MLGAISSEVAPFPLGGEVLDLQPVVSWAAPIASTVLTTYVVALINRNERRRDADRAATAEKRREEAEWRSDIERRLEEQDGKIDAVLAAQCTQMRSDAIHRAHRYIDDLGCASMEEKQSFFAEWEEYQHLCETYGITNNFVDNLVQQVMALPDRPKG